MARPKTQKRARDEDEDDLVDEEEAPKSTKKTTKKAKTTTAPVAGESAKDADDNKFWALSNNRRVNISEFKGKVLVNIREYYSDQAGDMKPGKKGISLSLEQYNALVKAIPDINAQLKDEGHETVEIPSTVKTAERPTSSSSSSSASPEPKKSKSKSKPEPKPKPKKANIEATSDEESEEN